MNTQVSDSRPIPAFVSPYNSTVVESHLDTFPSLRIDKAFPALLDYSLSLDLANMEITDHGHIPYVVLLVRALEDWKKTVRSSYLFPSPIDKATAQRPPADLRRQRCIQVTSRRTETQIRRRKCRRSRKPSI